MQCKNCSTANPDTNNYCGNCGSPLGKGTSLREIVDAGYLKAGESITCKIKGQEVAATVMGDGRIQYGDKVYDTPFEAMIGVRGSRCDSWFCWKCKDAEGGKDKPLHNLRVALMKARQA